MSFKLVGEVIIDGRKGTTALKDLQREANKTSDTFKRAGGNTERLGKSLLSLGLNAGRAGSSLGSLARLGTGGLFGAAVLGSINKFGETVKQASTDYYASQKALSDAFETSFKSTSVEQAQAGLEKTEDTIESLRGKITQLGAFGGILKGIESLTGINLGVGDTEKAIESARANLSIQEQLVQVRKNEANIIKNSSENLRNANAEKELRKIARAYDEIENAGSGAVENAVDQLNYSKLQVMNYQWQIEQIFKLNGALQDAKKIDELRVKLGEANLQRAKEELNVIRVQREQRAITAKRSQEAGGGLLGASRAGQQALDVARKVRAREVSKEDFKTQDQVFERMKTEENIKRRAKGLPPVTAQQMREQVASQQAAGEMPLLSEKLGAMQGGTPASQVAAEKARGGGGVDMQKQLLEAIKALSKQIPAAVATG